MWGSPLRQRAATPIGGHPSVEVALDINTNPRVNRGLFSSHSRRRPLWELTHIALVAFLMLFLVGVSFCRLAKGKFSGLEARRLAGSEGDGSEGEPHDWAKEACDAIEEAVGPPTESSPEDAPPCPSSSSSTGAAEQRPAKRKRDATRPGDSGEEAEKRAKMMRAPSPPLLGDPFLGSTGRIGAERQREEEPRELFEDLDLADVLSQWLIGPTGKEVHQVTKEQTGRPDEESSQGIHHALEPPLPGTAKEQQPEAQVIQIDRSEAPKEIPSDKQRRLETPVPPTLLVCQHL